MVVLVTYKNEEDPIKNEGAIVATMFSQIKTLWEVFVAIETRVLIRSGPNIMQPFPHPNVASEKQ